MAMEMRRTAMVRDFSVAGSRASAAFPLSLSLYPICLAGGGKGFCSWMRALHVCGGVLEVRRARRVQVACAAADGEDGAIGCGCGCGYLRFFAMASDRTGQRRRRGWRSVGR